MNLTPILYIALALNVAIPPLLLMYEIKTHRGSLNQATNCPFFRIVAGASIVSALVIVVFMPAPIAFVGPALFIFSAPIAAMYADEADRRMDY